jgi:hypothetical protein
MSIDLKTSLSRTANATAMAAATAVTPRHER